MTHHGKLGNFKLIKNKIYTSQSILSLFSILVNVSDKVASSCVISFNIRSIKTTNILVLVSLGILP